MLSKISRGIQSQVFKQATKVSAFVQPSSSSKQNINSVILSSAPLPPVQLEHSAINMNVKQMWRILKSDPTPTRTRGKQFSRVSNKCLTSVLLNSITPTESHMQFSKAPIMKNFGELPAGEIPESLKYNRPFRKCRQPVFHSSQFVCGIELFLFIITLFRKHYFV